MHLSTAGAVEHLRLARLHGLDVHGECCPHHLLLDESRYLGERPATSSSARRCAAPSTGRRSGQGLVDGTLEVVAADHAAWPAPLKAPGPGFLEAVHGAAATGCCCRCWRRRSGQVEGFGWEHVARLSAENPARIFRLPGKGAIAPGRDADLVVLNPEDVGPCRPCRPTGWSTTGSSGTSRTFPRARSCSAAARSRRPGSSSASRPRARFVPGVM